MRGVQVVSRCENLGHKGGDDGEARGLGGLGSRSREEEEKRRFWNGSTFYG